MDNNIPHILIVDDDTNLLATMNDILKLKGFEPVMAQTGGIALAQLEKHRFDLALVDLRLEDMSGLKVLDGIKDRSPETECILLTGHASQNSAIEAIQMGVFGYFQKPFDMDQVLLSIQRAMEKSAAKKALRDSELRYRGLFEDSPIALREENFSEVKQYLDHLKQEGVADFQKYLTLHPEIVLECTAKVKIVDVNKAALKMFRADSKNNLPMIFTEILNSKAIEHFRDQLANIAEGQTQFKWEGIDHTVNGEQIDVEVNWLVAAGHENDLSKVIVSLQDITARKQAEIEIKERTEDLELVNELNQAVNRGDSLENIMEVFARELRRISVCKDATIYLLSPDGKNLVMQHLSLSPAVIKKIEQLIGRPLPQIQIPIKEGGYFQQALQSKYGILATDPKIIQQWMGEFAETNYLPATVRGAILKLIPQIYKLLDIRSTLVIPLVSDKKVIGLLDVSSSEMLTEKDLSRIQKMSGQLTAVVLREQANQALLESEERYRLIFDGVQDAIFVESKDGRILGANNRACEMYGYNHVELLGKTIRDLAPDGNITFPLPHMQSNISYSPLETINRRANGELFPIEISGRLQTINDEEMLLVIVRDITERKQARDALVSSEENLRKAQHHAHVGSWSWNIKTNRLKWSDEMYQIFGIDKGSFTGNLADVIAHAIHPDDREKVNNSNRNVVEQSKPIPLEYRVVWQDGTTRVVWAEAGEFILDEAGNPAVLSGIVQDITERKQAEEALRESENKYRLLFDEMLSGVAVHEIICDGQGKPIDYRFLAINPAFENMTGVVSATTIGRTVLEVMPETESFWIERYGQVALTREPAQFENYSSVLGKYFEVRAFSPEPRQFATIFNDITERKQSEEVIHQRVNEMELLYQSGLAFSQLINQKEIAQKIIELLGEKLDWHHTAIRLVRPQDEGLELLAFDQPGLENQVEEHTVESHLSKIITGFGDGLSGWALEQSRIVRSGDVNSDPHYLESFPGIHSGLYVPLKSGERMLGVISIESERPNAFSEADEQLITTLANQAANAFENARLYEEINHYAEELEQRVQERTAEIESTRQRLELAVKTAGIGIWELDIKQNLEYWDDKLFALFGLSKENTPASSKVWQNAIHPDDLAQQLKLMDETLYYDQPYNSEYRMIWPDSSIHYIKSIGIVVRDEAGLPERMIGAIQDITLARQAEETLRLANVEMERALRTKDEFLSTMSHELRTPLNAILGISESLEEQISGTLNEKQLKYVRVISESGRHLLELINDILDLSKIEAGKLELNIHPISVEKLCASSLRMVKELAQKKSLNISFKIDEKVKVILGDERRLKQSLVNLFGNAVKFTPQGNKIGLEVYGNAEANEVAFTVWDEGIGIDQEDIKLLFQPFVQLNVGLAREYAGSGLGLALVAQMVRLHGGRIDLTSKLKMGSRFTITLPWMPTEQGLKLPIKTQVLADSPKPSRKRIGKILIVDDTEVVAQLISEYFRHKGYETLMAYNGSEAVLLAKQEHPQIILMDVMMPVMNGLDATRQIRADATLHDIPIIGLTALAMPADRAQCLAAGMNDYLSKPIQMHEMAEIIEHYLPQTS